MNALDVLPANISGERIDLVSDNVSLWPLVSKLTQAERLYFVTILDGWDAKFEDRLAEEDKYRLKCRKPSRLAGTRIAFLLDTQPGA